MLVILFGLIIVAGAAQVIIASQDRPSCPGPTTAPDAMPADLNAECEEGPT